MEHIQIQPKFTHSKSSYSKSIKYDGNIFIMSKFNCLGEAAESNDGSHIKGIGDEWYTSSEDGTIKISHSNTYRLDLIKYIDDISGEQHIMKLYVGIESIEPISRGIMDVLMVYIIFNVKIHMVFIH
eukprot:451191_1